jgi:hypothetical protein
MALNAIVAFDTIAICYSFGCPADINVCDVA